MGTKTKPNFSGWQWKEIKAFTLVELMVVVAILAILAALLVPVLHRLKNRNQSVPAEVRQQSPLPATSPVVLSGWQFQVNDAALADDVRQLLLKNGYKVEPVTDKSSLVFKP